MSFSIQRNGASLVVTVSGDLVNENRNEFRRKVEDEIDAGARHLRIDFQFCGYIASSGLGALVGISKKLREAGGDQVQISGLNSDLHTLFMLTKLDTLFAIADSEPHVQQYARVDGRSAR